MPSLRGLDLNLLRVFDALMRRRGVTAAAADLGLTQSSTSNALDRLRRALGDRLLERQGNVMVPTRRALDLWPAIAEALSTLAAGLAGFQSFEPARADLRFRIGMDDYAVAVAAHRLCHHVVRAAPSLAIEIVPAGHPSDENRLRAGELDLFVGAVWQPAPRLAASTLLDETFVGLAAANCPWASGTAWSAAPGLDDYLARPHLLVSALGAVPGNVDAGLALIGRSRRVTATLPTFDAAARTAAQGDGLLSCGRTLAGHLAATHGLRAFEIPLAVPGYAIRQLWNPYDSPAPAHRWLRETVAATFASLAVPDLRREL